jgi:hypothetical protein
MLVAVVAVGCATSSPPVKKQTGEAPPGIVTRELAETAIELVDGDRRIFLMGNGLGAIDPDGAGHANPWFVVDVAEVERLLATIDAAGFAKMPGMFGVTSQDPREDPGMLYSLSVTQGWPVRPTQKRVYQSKLGDRSAAFAALVDEVRATCERAAAARPLKTASLGEDLALIQKGVLPPEALRVAAIMNRYDGGVIVGGWSLVVYGRWARVTLHGDGRQEKHYQGELTAGELARLRELLAAGATPYMGYVKSSWQVAQLHAAVMNMTILQSTPTNVALDEANQATFDRVVPALEAIERRIVAENQR